MAEYAGKPRIALLTEDPLPHYEPKQDPILAALKNVYDVTHILLKKGQELGQRALSRIRTAEVVVLDTWDNLEDRAKTYIGLTMIPQPVLVADWCYEGKPFSVGLRPQDAYVPIAGQEKPGQLVAAKLDEILKNSPKTT